MTWAVQRFLASRSKKYRMRSLCRSSNRHDDRNDNDNDDNNDNQSTAECSETGNTSISNNITPLRRLSRDNLNQHMRKTNSNHGGDDDNSSISSFNSHSLLSVDHLREHYSSRHDPLKVKDNEIKSLRALLQRERNEKDSLRALLLKERAEKDYLIQLYEDRQLATKTSRREIIWELNFVDYKVTFKSSPFSFLDKIWHLHFIRSDDAHFGFYLELSTCYQSDRNAVIYLMALFKLHHAFKEPLVKTKPEPLKYFEGEKRGLMNFISYDNLLNFLNQENILKLSVVLELAN